MSQFIPQEVVEQILSKLPIKALLRFLTVSKEWYKLIPTLKFDKRCPQMLIAFESFANKSFHFCMPKNGTFEEYSKYEYPLELRSSPPDSVFANGLLCVSGSTNDQVAILWNPSIRKSLLLPESNLGPKARFRTVFGIVLDQITHDYKILRSIETDDDDDLSVEIYRLSTGSWELVNYKFPACPILLNQVELNGIYYWTPYGHKYESAPMMLFSFDGHEESFGFMYLEFSALHPKFQFFYIFVWKESFVFATYDCKTRRGMFVYNIWKMEPSDAKSLNLLHEISFDHNMTPLGFRENNGEFIWSDGYGKYISTTLADEFTTMSFVVDPDKTLPYITRVDPYDDRDPKCISDYVENLILLDVTLKQSQHPSLR